VSSHHASRPPGNERFIDLPRGADTSLGIQVSHDASGAILVVLARKRAAHAPGRRRRREDASIERTSNPEPISEGEEAPSPPPPAPPREPRERGVMFAPIEREREPWREADPSWAAEPVRPSALRTKPGTPQAPKREPAMPRSLDMLLAGFASSSDESSDEEEVAVTRPYSEEEPPSALNGFGAAAFAASIQRPPTPPPVPPPAPPPSKLSGPLAFSDGFIAEAAAAGVRLRSLFDDAARPPPRSTPPPSGGGRRRDPAGGAARSTGGGAKKGVKAPVDRSYALHSMVERATWQDQTPAEQVYIYIYICMYIYMYIYIYIYIYI